MHRNPDASFQSLFYDYYVPVVRKLIPMVGGKAAAEDLAQEAFLKLYRNPPEDLSRAGAWLNRVAVNLAYDYLRHEAVRSRQLAREREAASFEKAAVPSNEEIALENLDKQNVRKALDQLSKRDRSALLLREQGYSYAEIAERTGVGTTSVGSLLMRAEARFKRNYDLEEGYSHERTVQG